MRVEEKRFIMSQQVLNRLMLSLFLIITLMLGISIYALNVNIGAEQQAEQHRTVFKELGASLADASDYLTDEARKYAATHDVVHMENYWREIEITRTRDKAIAELQSQNSTDEEQRLLAEAKQHSDELVETERRSMRLIQEAEGVPAAAMLPEVSLCPLSASDEALSAAAKSALALQLMFDEDYDYSKERIMRPIAEYQNCMNARLDHDLYHAQHSLQNAFILQTVLAGVIIAAIAGMISLFAAQLTRPIRNYIRSLREFSLANRHFRIRPEGTDELWLLAQSFNELYSSFLRELIQRRRAEKHMREARDEAELANRAKSEFLANMSHEIRTPLSTIIGYHYLLNEDTLPMTAKQYVSNIGIAAKNLLGIVNEILDFSKIEAGRMSIEHIPFAFLAEVNEVAMMIEQAAKEKKLCFQLVFDPAMPGYLWGDPLRIKQILLNLLSNAIKFTSVGRIELRIEYDAAQTEIRFIVKDSGIGMDDAQQAHVFAAFTQADVSTSRKYGGTGLGLAISRELAELMGGRLWVKSRVLEGSSFFFSLPAIPASKEDLPLEPPGGEIVGKFSRQPVLLVEDHAVNRAMAQEILEHMGLQVTAAASGQQALDAAVVSSFALVLLDLRMPFMDGYETLQRLRKLPGYAHKPVIALSADVVAEAKKRVQEAGMDGFLEKPLRPVELYRLLARFFPVVVPVKKTPISMAVQQQMNSPAKLNTVDALERLDGDRQSYRNILNLFLQAEHRCTFGQLEKWTAEERENYLHTLKGSAANVGADCLAQASQRLLKQQRAAEAILEPDWSAYQQLLDDTIQAVQQYLVTSVAVPIKVRTTVEFEPGRLEQLLAQGNLEAQTYFAIHKEAYRAGLDAQTYRLLSEKIIQYDFLAAAELLQNRQKQKVGQKDV